MTATAIKAPPVAKPAPPIINAQTEVYGRWLGKAVRIALQSGREILGTLRVFDQYVLVVQQGTSGPTQVVYKHAIEAVELFLER